MGCSNGKSKKLDKLNTAPSVSYPEKRLQLHPKKNKCQFRSRWTRNNYKHKESTKTLRYVGQVCQSSILYLETAPKTTPTSQFNTVLMQHNLTGKIRKINILKKQEKNSDAIIDWLTHNTMNHPNILKIYEIFQDDESYYITYENTVGGTLLEWMKQKQNKLSETQISIIINQMISALHYLHSMGMYHGNLTIDSFELLDQSGVIKLKLVDIQTAIAKPEATLTSVPYTSPECCVNNEYTAARDIWAIGIIMYYLLSGYLPYSISRKYTIDNIKSEIRRQLPTCDGVDFEMRSDQAKQFLAKLLKRNPLDRMTKVGILKEIWVKQSIKQDLNQSQQWCNLAQQTKRIGLLQSSILYYMINQFCSEEQQKLIELFNQLDINKDNKLSRMEIMKLYTATYNEEESMEQVNRIFKYADVDNSGEIDFYEFIVSITDKQGLITKENIDILFKLLADKNGSISIHHLSTKFGIPKQTIFLELQQQLSSQTSHKQITYECFKQLMFKLLD